MSTPEGKIEGNVCRRAMYEYGVRHKKILAGDDTGWPDQMFLIPGGKPLFIEFKAPGKMVRPGSKQDYIISKMKELGYDVQTHDNEEQAIQAIATALEAACIPKKRR